MGKKLMNKNKFSVWINEREDLEYMFSAHKMQVS